MNAIVATDIRIVREGTVVVGPSSFTIPTASTVAIIGPNGSGKSSILHAITGLLEIDQGQLRVLGKKPEDALSDVAYVLQYMPITPGIPMTVRELVRMGRFTTRGPLGRLRSSDRQRVSEAMEQLDIVDLAGRSIHQLSGGQRQRVFVAQALAQDHSVLLLDEPLTGLDVPSAKVIDHIIHDEPEQGCTVLYTTHDLEEARSADYVTWPRPTASVRYTRSMDQKTRCWMLSTTTPQTVKKCSTAGESRETSHQTARRSS